MTYYVSSGTLNPTHSLTHLRGLDRARLVVKASFSQNISSTAICPLLTLIWNLTTRCYDSHLHIGPNIGLHGPSDGQHRLRCKKWDQQHLYLTLTNRNVSSWSVACHWHSCKKVFTFFLYWSRFFTFLTVQRFLFIKTSTKRYANDEKRLCATVTKPRHLDSWTELFRF